MSDLTDRRANVDVVLTNLSIGIPVDQDFIGDQLLPPIPVTLSTAKIPVWGTEAFRIREDKVGDYSEPDKLDISIDTTLLEVEGHALMAPVSRRHQQESLKGPLQIDLDMEALVTVKANMALSREKLQADLLTSTAIYGATHKVDVNGIAHLWDNPANNPLDDLVPMVQTTIPDDSGKVPNVLALGQQVWAKLLTNTALKEALVGTIAPTPSPDELKARLGSFLGLQKVLIGRALSKTAGGTNTKLWGKNAVLLYVPPTAGKRIPAFGYTVEQTVFGGASESVVRFPDEKMGASGGDWIKRSAFYTPASLFPNAGALFYNAVA
jgi:hypothetical protein